MIKKITYIAIDGKEFDTEEDCRNYENTIDNPFNGFTFFDTERNVLNKNYSISEVLYFARYLYVDKHLNVLELISNLERMEEYDEHLFDNFKKVPTKLLYGLWFYDNNDNKWKNCNTLKTYYDDLERELTRKIDN